jgi:hypothetical protein
MDQIVFNIGYIGHGSSGILSHYPMTWDCDFKTFAKKMRQKGNIKSLFKWAKLHYVTPSSMAIFVSVYEGDMYSNYTIKMMNVREYRKHWETIYKKEWKDVSRL